MVFVSDRECEDVSPPAGSGPAPHQSHGDPGTRPQTQDLPPLPGTSQTTTLAITADLQSQMNRNITLVI